MGDLNLPFERNPEPAEIPLDQAALFSGGVVVMSVGLPTPDGRVHPAVMLRFATADGRGFYAPIIMAPDRPADLRTLPDLLRQAVDAAIEEAAKS